MLAYSNGIYKDFRELWSRKIYSVSIVLTMLLSYGTLLINPTVGIDDTAFSVYFEDGVAPAMGRWCLYLIHKIFPLGYNPYVVEGVGLILFGISITLWCIVFYRMFGRTVSDAGYAFFGCIMLSSPIISELIVWYLHNGIFMGYGVTALAVLCGMEAYRKRQNGKGWGDVPYLILSAVFLTVALGFYESFMIVFLMGMLMVFMLIRILKKEEYNGRIGKWILYTAAEVLGSIMLRTVIVKGITLLFRLESQKDVLKSRGLYEVLGWFDGSRSFDDFIYIMKEFFVKYYINGVVYLPITILVLAAGILILFAIVKSIRSKDVWILLAGLGVLMLPWIMPVLEGVATYYRTSQYIPLLTAFSVLLVIWEYQKKKRNICVRSIGLFLAMVLLYQQVYELGKWLYLDARKYEDTKSTLDAVALNILENHDASKPICIIGEYGVPESLLQEGCTPKWSKKYTIVSTLVKIVDEDIFDQYDTKQGYLYGETIALSFIDWGSAAFYGFDREIIKFWKMHGFTFAEDGNLSHYEEAEKYMEDGPVWPEQDSIVEMEEYIIVNFG